MDGCSIEAVGAAASVLLPIAVHVGRGCFARIRDPRKVQKSVLVLPHRGGKTHLHDALVHQHQILVVDVDEEIKALATDKELEKLQRSPIGSIEYEMDYDDLADRVLDMIKKRLRHHKGLRVLFLTSSLTWAKSFKTDAVYLASPDAEFWAKIIATETSEAKREELRKAREQFLNSVDKKTIQTYGSFAQLVDAVKKRMRISSEL